MLASKEIGWEAVSSFVLKEQYDDRENLCKLEECLDEASEWVSRVILVPFHSRPDHQNSHLLSPVPLLVPWVLSVLMTVLQCRRE